MIICTIKPIPMPLDINCDMGEGFDNDPFLFPYITSANIACGGHAGDVQSMTITMLLAKKHGVNAGIHPSYPDRQNFGREKLEILLPDLMVSLAEQITSAIEIAQKNDVVISHVKPHGALYHELSNDQFLAENFLNLLTSFHQPWKVFAASGSRFLQQARSRGFETLSEVFADRAYGDDGQLVPRSERHAVFTTVPEVLEQVRCFLNKQPLTIHNGKKIKLEADTICIHGDGLHAVEFAENIHHFMAKNLHES